MPLHRGSPLLSAYRGAAAQAKGRCAGDSERNLVGWGRAACGPAAGRRRDQRLLLSPLDPPRQAGGLSAWRRRPCRRLCCAVCMILRLLPRRLFCQRRCGFGQQLPSGSRRWEPGRSPVDVEARVGLVARSDAALDVGREAVHRLGGALNQPRLPRICGHQPRASMGAPASVPLTVQHSKIIWERSRAAGAAKQT